MATAAGEETARVRCIGRYTLHRLLGDGGMGEVWEALDGELGRSVAIKLLRPGRLATDAARGRLRREAQAMARLNHPNVAAIHDIGATDEGAFIAMELLECTLREWLLERPRPWREIASVLIAAGTGIAAAHRTGIIHRDIKPDNVLLGAGGAVKVADFGIAGDAARALDLDAEIDPLASLATDEAIAGTPAYMAPEQIRGQQADQRADQFSFCVMAWEALHGTLPFPSVVAPGVPTLARQLAGITRGELVRGTARIPGAVERVLRRGLALDPEQRYPSLDALLADLNQVRRPSRGWIAIVGIAIVALGITGAVALTCRAPRARPAGFVARPLTSTHIDPTIGLVAMARDGNSLAITRVDGRSLQLITIDGDVRGTFELPVQFLPRALAITEDGNAVAIGGMLDDRWEVWHGARGAKLTRVARLPEAGQTQLQELNGAPTLAIVGTQIVVAHQSAVYVIDRPDSVRVLARLTTIAVRTRPGTNQIGILEQDGAASHLRIQSLDGRTLATYDDLPGFASAFDWIDATHVALVVVERGATRVYELALGDREITARRELGSLQRGAIALFASPHRLLAIEFDLAVRIHVGHVSTGRLEQFPEGGWIGYPAGWLDNTRIVAHARLLDRRAVVTMSSDAPPRVFGDIPGKPRFIDGELVVSMGNEWSPFCGVRASRGTTEVAMIDVPCQSDPRLLCASITTPPCLFARWEDGRDVYRTFDPRRMTIGEPVFVDPEAKGVGFIDAALSGDGSRLAIPRATGGVTVVELASGQRLELARDDRSGWQSVAFLGDGTLAVTAADAYDRSRVLRVGLDGSLGELFESSRGVFGVLRTSPDGDKLAMSEISLHVWPTLLELAP